MPDQKWSSKKELQLHLESGERSPKEEKKQVQSSACWQWLQLENKTRRKSKICLTTIITKFIVIMGTVYIISRQSLGRSPTMISKKLSHSSIILQARINLCMEDATTICNDAKNRNQSYEWNFSWTKNAYSPSRRGQKRRMDNFGELFELPNRRTRSTPVEPEDPAVDWLNAPFHASNDSCQDSNRGRELNEAEPRHDESNDIVA